MRFIIGALVLFTSAFAFAGGSIGGTNPSITEEVLLNRGIEIDSESPFVLFDQEKNSLTINPKLTEIELTPEEWKSAMSSAVADETVPIKIKGLGFSDVTPESIDLIRKRLYGKLENGEHILIKPKVNGMTTAGQ